MRLVDVRKWKVVGHQIYILKVEYLGYPELIIYLMVNTNRHGLLNHFFYEEINTKYQFKIYIKKGLSKIPYLENWIIQIDHQN